MVSEEFKQYFKFPLIYRENYIYVLGHDGEPVLTWLVNSNDIVEDQQEIINKMNGYSTKKYDKEWTVQDSVFIYYGDKKMFLIRGCDLLMNHKKYSFPHEQALKLQRNFIDFIINNLNKK